MNMQMNFSYDLSTPSIADLVRIRGLAADLNLNISITSGLILSALLVTRRAWLCSRL